MLPNPSTNMQVSAGAGMNVLVEAGFALCNGCMALEESQRTLAVQASDSVHDRIDTVVLRLNDNDSVRTCDLYVLQGVAAASPIRPSLTRTESIWEIGLADLFITPNSSAISNQRITDTRYEVERCGIISAINEFDTTTIYEQVQADLVGFKEEEQAQFVEWFNYMKDQLSEDAAGNLQLQIDDTNSKIGIIDDLTTGVKDTIVKAINWLNNSLTTLSNSLVALAKRVSKNETDISNLNTNFRELNSDLEHKGLGSNIAFSVGVVKVDYLDGATLMSTATLGKTFKTDNMYAFVQPIGGYNTKKFTIVTQNISGNQVSILVRADAGTEFVSGDHIYANILVYGELA